MFHLGGSGVLGFVVSLFVLSHLTIISVKVYRKGIEVVFTSSTSFLHIAVCYALLIPYSLDIQENFAVSRPVALPASSFFIGLLGNLSLLIPHSNREISSI